MSLTSLRSYGGVNAEGFVLQSLPFLICCLSEDVIRLNATVFRGFRRADRKPVTGEISAGIDTLAGRRAC
jgi:hypothetical protein